MPSSRISSLLGGDYPKGSAIAHIPESLRSSVVQIKLSLHFFVPKGQILPRGFSNYDHIADSDIIAIQDICGFNIWGTDRVLISNSPLNLPVLTPEVFGDRASHIIAPLTMGISAVKGMPMYPIHVGILETIEEYLQLCREWPQAKVVVK